MTNISKGKQSSGNVKTIDDRNAFLHRITKSLYYSKLPVTDCLSLPVTELAAELFTDVRNGRTLERLDVEEASRISRNACVSPCSLVLALLYLERLKDRNPEYLGRVAPSELFLVSLMVASKFLQDDGEDDEVFNAEWAESGDLTVTRMNQLEKEFLRAIGWQVFVGNLDFWNRLRKLERDIAYKEARKRGWFSYTELTCLMDSVHLVALANAVIQMSSICLATYAAGVVTLLGSALVASHLPGSLSSPRGVTTSCENRTISSEIPLTLEPESESETQSELLLAKTFADKLVDHCSRMDFAHRVRGGSLGKENETDEHRLEVHLLDGRRISLLLAEMEEKEQEQEIDDSRDGKEKFNFHGSWELFANYITQVSLGH